MVALVKLFCSHKPRVVVKVLGVREIPVLFGDTKTPAHLLETLMGTSVIAGRLETRPRLLGVVTCRNRFADPASSRGVSE